MFVGCQWGFRKNIRLAKFVVFCQSYILVFGGFVSCGVIILGGECNTASWNVEMFVRDLLERC